jgi:hypothetical protein
MFNSTAKLRTNDLNGSIWRLDEPGLTYKLKIRTWSPQKMTKMRMKMRMINAGLTGRFSFAESERAFSEAR